jgi:hypothetical protein
MEISGKSTQRNTDRWNLSIGRVLLLMFIPTSLMTSLYAL